MHARGSGEAARRFLRISRFALLLQKKREAARSLDNLDNDRHLKREIAFTSESWARRL